MLGVNDIFKGHATKNGLYVNLRLAFIALMSVAIYVLVPREVETVTALQDILIPAIVAIVALGAVGVMASIKSVRAFTPLMIIPTDWIVGGTYIYFAAYRHPILLVMVLATLIVGGVLRLGRILGGFQSIVLLVMSVGLLGLMQPVGWEALSEEWRVYASVLLVAVALFALTWAWYERIHEDNSTNVRQLQRDMQENVMRVANMQERARSFADMAARLTSTLNYDQILDAAMDIGRLSIRHDSKERLVSLALMVSGDNELYIETARGVNHLDDKQTFRTNNGGIIEECMTEGLPIVSHEGENDPELGRLTAFRGVRTTLAVPLRVNFETFGLLIFGTTAYNAINEDHIDTLSAIGLQATIALQNAVLYDAIREEKERILRIESNGRKSLVRDLHDIPTQTISAVAMQLSVLPMVAERQPEQLKQEIEMIRTMALRASEEIRHVMFTLRPLALENNGLSAALKQLAEKMQETYRQQMVVEIDPRIEQILDQEEQGTLFYLIEEAANNARKYAQAPLIQVKGIVTNGEIAVRIRDNGKGFDTSSVTQNYERRGSFGMVNMHERAELVGGVLSIDSAPNRGTIVTVRIPVRGSVGNGRGNGAPSPAESSASKLIPRKVQKKYSGPLSPAT